MSDTGLLDEQIQQWDTDPEFILEGVLTKATERICELMDKHGISRAELARRLGKSRAYVTRLLNGQPNMTLKTLIEIAVALGEGIEVFIPSSVTEDRWRALQADLAEHRKRRIKAEQHQWRAGAVVLSGRLPIVRGRHEGEQYEPIAV